MYRSKKYSYFAGKTAKLSDDPILYERYVAPSSVGTTAPKEDTPQVAQDSEKKVRTKKRDPPSEGGDAVVKKVRKKERWSEEKKAAVRAEKEAAKKDAPEGHDDAKSNKKKKKKKKKKNKDKKDEESDKEEEVPLRKLTAEERVSGPSNAAEAQALRGALGFVDTAATDEGKNAASFQFGFGSQIEVEPVKEEEEIQSEEEEASSSDTSSSSSSSDDSDQDEEDQEHVTSGGVSDKQANDTTNNNKYVAPVQLQQQEEEEVDADGFIPRRIFVGGMPFGYTEDMVREYWEYCGPIETLDVMVFPDTGRFKGIAFITFATQEAYQSALSFDGTDCDGQILKVQKCKADAKKRYKKQPSSADGRNEAKDNNNHAEAPALGTQHRPPAQKVQGYNVAYVGNIAFEASPEDIKTLFEPYGVTIVRLHTDKDTGKPKGYAHVHFKDEESLDKAMALNGTPILGRKIRVGYAQLKKNAS
ncbi:hypothetical protein M9434_004534 [Picochlorum sp. BPE23]|nr:hypothetical protein M9434_004534 [Picochlorum sp. BPE23]